MSAVVAFMVNKRWHKRKNKLLRHHVDRVNDMDIPKFAGGQDAKEQEKEKYGHDVAHEGAHEGHTISEMASPVAELEGVNDWYRIKSSDR
jgi:hypothetical protein